MNRMMAHGHCFPKDVCLEANDKVRTSVNKKGSNSRGATIQVGPDVLRVSLNLGGLNFGQ